MKNIKEKQLLVKWAKAMGEEVDAALLEEVERHEQFEKSILESVRENLLADLSTASKIVPKVKTPDYPIPPSIEDLETLLEEAKHELVQTETIKETSLTGETIPCPPAIDIVSRVVNHIAKEVRLEEKVDSYQQPSAELSGRSVNDIRKKIKFLEDWVSKISLAGPGGGTYWLYDMGDTNYNLVKAPNNGDVLTYNSANTKWEVNNVTNLLGTRYHGSYYDMTPQYANVNSAPYFIKLGVVDFQNGFTTDGANIIATYAGTYNLQFSVQLHRKGGAGSGDLVEIWLSKDGVDQPSTGGIIHVGPNNPYTVSSWNYLVPMAAGSKVALRWGSLNTNIILETSSSGIGPTVPSVITTITSV